MRLLIAEDDPALGRFLARGMEQDGPVAGGGKAGGDESVRSHGGKRLGASGRAHSCRGRRRQYGERGDHAHGRRWSLSAAACRFTSTAPEQSFAGQLLGQTGGSGAEIGGVRVSAVVADQGNPLRRYDPGHPDADKDGYVSYPDINPLTEMVDLMGATRAYGLNSSAVQAEKGMLSASLDILK